MHTLSSWYLKAVLLQLLSEATMILKLAIMSRRPVHVDLSCTWMSKLFDARLE